jgi:Arc/MetJ-type ribon-helix-helix transcriptional regulator
VKIITVNLPESTIELIKKLLDEYQLYPSRSELVRVAVREFLIREFQNLEKYKSYQKEPGLFPLSRSGTIDMRTVRFHRNMEAE